MVIRNVAALSRPDREHPPRRPSWTCRTCENDWPCAAARAMLPAEFRLDPLALFVYLGICLYEATADLCKLSPDPGPDPAALHARFLGWVPERRLIIGALARRFAAGYPATPIPGTKQSPVAPDTPGTERTAIWPDTNSGP